MVPGHEIVGKVTRVGSGAKKFNIGDTVGVGCFVDSCRTCDPCHRGLEQFCEGGMTGTYNSKDREGRPTYGGYSKSIVVDEKYVLRVSDKIPLERAAPLLCAGITTFSPLRHWKIGKGHKVAVVGLGGLGHMAVKFANSFGAEVTVLSSTANKREAAKALGAHHYEVTSDPNTFTKLAGHFDYILNTISAPHDYNAYLNLLRLDGTMTLVGVPEQAIPVHAFPLIMKRRNLSGSLIGGIAETQEMLDYCAKHNIASDVEVIAANQINTAYERMLKGDVKYRFVIDTKSL